MITRRAFSSGFAASLLPLHLPATAQASLSTEARRAEAETLRRFAEATHPRGREAGADADWQERWSRLAEAADRLDDGAYLIAVRRALGWFRDGHTTTLPFEFVGGVPAPLRPGPFGLSMPFRVRLFEDGAYVVAASEPARRCLGRRIDRIGQVSAAELVRRVALHWPGNDAWAHRWAAGAFEAPAFLRGFEAVADANAPLRLRLGALEAELSPERTASTVTAMGRRQLPHETWAAAAGGGNYIRPLPERRALYISIDEMGDIEARSFETLTREAFAAMETPGLDRLIVDLRRNGGGNNYFGEPLRRRIASSRFNRPGGLFVLTSPRTFSAAQNLANRLERETFALFVGEPTGGAPNHYGDAQSFTGDATGIVAIVSTLPWFDSYPQDRRVWIAPDLPVPDRFDDWRNGRDPSLEAALTHQSDGTGDELDRNRIFYFRRPTQAVEWRPFWREAGGQDS